MQSEDDLIALITAPASSQPPTSPGLSTDHHPASSESSDDPPSSQQPASPELSYLHPLHSPHLVTDETSPAGVVEEHKKEIKRRRIEASASKLSQAERMVQRCHIQFKPGCPGDNVAVPIPSVDRGRGDPRNIQGVILYRDERDQYNIAVKSGILKGLYSRNQFAESATGGQGFTKCNCQGSKKCQTNRCKCYKLLYSAISGVRVA
ncbi:hypothetical protein LOD99_1862 [Oopsacas minuta]|uniref:Uncharacterized protein n=1 Tax=Oopsacas minuta TaxID=111878 RepID=A0AAV7K543_9METZ|nr:hypothetical protein LOD99_1862 [Oopsacas minuta]